MNSRLRHRLIPRPVRTAIWLMAGLLVILPGSVPAAHTAVFTASSHQVTSDTPADPGTLDPDPLIMLGAASSALSLERDLDGQTLWWRMRVHNNSEQDTTSAILHLRTPHPIRPEVWSGTTRLTNELFRTHQGVALPVVIDQGAALDLTWRVDGVEHLHADLLLEPTRRFHTGQQWLGSFMIWPPLLGVLWAAGWLVFSRRGGNGLQAQLKHTGYLNHYGILWPAYLLAISLFALCHYSLANQWLPASVDYAFLGAAAAISWLAGSADITPRRWQPLRWIAGAVVLLVSVSLPLPGVIIILLLAAILCLYATSLQPLTTPGILRISGILSLIVWCAVALIQHSNLAMNHTLLPITEMALLILNGALLTVSFLSVPPAPAPPAEKSQPETTESALLPALRHINHELRSPIHGVLGMTSLLQETPLTHDQREYLLSSEAATQQMLNQMDELKTYTRILAGQMTSQVSSVQLEDFIHETVTPFARIASQRDVEVVTEILPNAPSRVQIDTVMVSQVLRILLDNSARATGEGVIQVTVRHEETSSLRVRVDDSGRGIEPDALQRLFEWPRLDRKPDPDSSQEARWHIGLPVAQHLVQQMQGHIGASRTSGHGTSVWFVIPYLPVSDPEPTPEPERLSPLSQQPILIVDDYPACRKVLENQTKRWGMRPEQAASGETALAMLQSHLYFHDPFDWVIIDYRMPEMNGLELLRRIRNTPGLAHLRCILMTGVDYPYVEQEAHRYGVRHILAKPVNARELERYLKDEQ